MTDVNLPFHAEYAKSSRSSCKGCKLTIEKEDLRMGIMVQSPSFDGKIPLWHHMKCFLSKKKKLQSVSEISNFSNLRYEDQKTLKDHIDGKTDAASTKSNGTSKKQTRDPDFGVEYSKSSRSTCKICSEKILKGVVRIFKLDHDSAEAHRFGAVPRWHHVDCFVTERQELDYLDSGEQLTGFNLLSAKDQKLIKGKLKPQGKKRKEAPCPEPPPKVAKTENSEDVAMQSQSKMFFDIRDKLKENLNKKELIELLEFNNQHISVGESRILDNLADCMVFGALKPCPECKIGKPRFKIDIYRCTGNLTEWTSCQYATKTPERKPFIVPDELKASFDFLLDYKCVIRERIFDKSAEAANPHKLVNLPLDDFKIVLLTKAKQKKSVLTEKIKELGGTVGSIVGKAVSCIVGTEAEFKKGGTKITKAEALEIHVVTEKFIEQVKNGVSAAIAMKGNLLSTWGDDPILKFGIKEEGDSKSLKKAKSLELAYTKSVPKKVKVTVHGSAAVEPESGLQEKAHVYERGDCAYNVVLGRVDISQGKNSYYKLQILESNVGRQYWVFRAWGRVGTTIGKNKLDGLKTADSAVDLFEEIYLDRTGNVWENRKNFIKQPGHLYPLDIDYGQDQMEKKEMKPGANSLLPKSVQELICFIFDIEAMKKAMMEFELDLRKMPLGKLSKNQIEKAYLVLSEAQQVLQTGGNATKALDASNRFYTLIPHDFGMRKPPLLDNEEIIKLKIEMLDSLLEIEFAYNLLKSEGKTERDPIDEHYKKLNTDIEELNRNTPEFKNIEKYLKNTHAKTHSGYNLKLEEVFKVNRHGESDRYQKFKKLHNKKLLWHGSRLTNFVGILTNGLRIAPPEAPSTGYMFGKGIYFADMVSKSANYCFTSKQNSTGILLLCEVALGNMYERLQSDFIIKLPKDKHSTFGVGRTAPNPKDVIIDNDVEIPLGKPVEVKRDEMLSLLYNEYIVYDVNQVNIKYLLKVDFKYKY